MIKFLLLFLVLIGPLFPRHLCAQQLDLLENMDGSDEEFNIGGDIFSDFNENLDSSQVLEDERFYRYGRFFSFNLGLGLTSYTGNRGKAYDDDPPTYHASLTYFFNFLSAFNLGFEYSKHHMTIDTYVNAYDRELVGIIDVSMLRVFGGYRHYIDTSDLGTAITYSNPYFVGRLEYWYQTNKFTERKNIPTQNGGGLGVGLGMGLEFPIEIKSSYIGVEALWHTVNFFDKYTQDYRQLQPPHAKASESTYGYDDLTGQVISLMVTYNISW